MKLFEVTTPDGRVIRHKHISLETAQAAMLPGYAVTGEVFGADVNDAGGMVAPTTSKLSIMGLLLEAYGDELEDWLMERGIVRPLASAADTKLAGKPHHK